MVTEKKNYTQRKLSELARSG